MASRSIVVPVRNIMSVASLADDDTGIEDEEANIVKVKGFFDKATGEVVEQEIMLLLPADSFRDSKTLEWILSPKHEEDESLDLFNDLIASEFISKADQPKPSALQLMQINSAFDRSYGN